MATGGDGGVDRETARARRRERPPGGRLHTFVGADGAPLRYGHWAPENADARVAGTCLVLSGRREFIEKYFETIRDLLDRGYRVFTLDWRGQGRSVRLLDNRQKGHIDRFEDYLADLERFLHRIVLPAGDGPVTVLAHSMGGHLALRYAHDHPREIDRMILTAPMLGIQTRGLPDRAMRTIVRGACRAGLGKRYALFQHDYDDRCRIFEGNVLTADPERFADESFFVENDPLLAMGGVTFGWLRAALRSMATLNAAGYAEAITVPALLAIAGHDQVVDNAAAKQFAKRLPHGQSVTIADARHEILRETDPVRAMFWRLADEFLGTAPSSVG